MTRSDRALFRDAAKRAREVVAEVLKLCLCGGRFHIHHDVEPPFVEIERRALPPVGLTRPAFESIANVCFPDLFRRRDSDSRMRQIIAGDEEHCVAGMDFSARFVDSKKLATLRQSLRFRQRLRTAGVCSLFHLVPRLDGEALAAFATTAREHCLAILRPHANEEAVRALAAAVVRLKSALHVLTL